MQMTNLRGLLAFPKEHIRHLWEALKPEGALSWNPKVAGISFGLNEEDVELSTDMEDDPVVHVDFDVRFGWMSDGHVPDEGGEE